MNWANLPDVSSNFDDKVLEIKEHLALLKKLLNREAKISYRQGWHTKQVELFPHQTHPLKAGATLMIYNFMESVGNAMMRDIHKHLKDTFSNSPWKLSESNEPLQQKIINHAKNRKGILDDFVKQFELTTTPHNGFILQLWITDSFQGNTP